MSDTDLLKRAAPVSQWIISLVLSVMCCVCLLGILAFYITDQHITVSTVSLRMDLLQQRQDRMAAQIESLKRTPVAADVQKVAPEAGEVPVSQPAEAAASSDKPKAFIPPKSLKTPLSLP